MSNSLDPDQAVPLLGLIWVTGPNFLQSLLADDTGRSRVNNSFFYFECTFLKGLQGKKVQYK